MEISEPIPNPAVLVVEDDQLTIDYMKIMLNKSYRIHTAVSADEALGVLSETEVDIVLMDISLSGLVNGLDLTRRLRKDPSYESLPIIVTTAHSHQSTVDESYQAGCDAFFTKPFNRMDLLDTMSRLLADRRS